MRVVVVGATGNVGTSLLDRLVADPSVDSILGLARRRPELELAKTEWAEADVSKDDLAAHFRDADAVVHLAWAIQPSHDLDLLRRTNVEGSRRVFDAVAEARVPSLVYASSVGAYSPGPKDRKVDETWPTEGIRTSFYSRHKVEVERILDRFEADHPDVRTVRLRPGLIFKREAGAAVRRLFAGPLFPRWLASRARIPLVPRLPALRFQAVHSYDVGDAYRLAVTGDARGAFNIAADPVLDADELARILGARAVSVPRLLARRATAVTWRLHLQPTPEGWVDIALNVPLLDTTRAEDELGWRPEHDAGRALLDVLAGVRESAGLDTPVLAPDAGGKGREQELASGIGSTPGR